MQTEEDKINEEWEVKNKEYSEKIEELKKEV